LWWVDRKRRISLVSGFKCFCGCRILLTSFVLNTHHQSESASISHGTIPEKSIQVTVCPCVSFQFGFRVVWGSLYFGTEGPSCSRSVIYTAIRRFHTSVHNMPEEHLDSNERVIACTPGHDGTGEFPQITARCILFAARTRNHG
jgi:hypothetical protein